MSVTSLDKKKKKKKLRPRLDPYSIKFLALFLGGGNPVDS